MKSLRSTPLFFLIFKRNQLFYQKYETANTSKVAMSYLTFTLQCVSLYHQMKFQTRLLICAHMVVNGFQQAINKLSGWKEDLICDLGQCPLQNISPKSYCHLRMWTLLCHILGCIMVAQNVCCENEQVGGENVSYFNNLDKENDVLNSPIYFE